MCVKLCPIKAGVCVFVLINLGVFTPEISCPLQGHLYLVSQEMAAEYFGL